ncbi:MAG TPA: hypothetical protein VF723_11335 [Pyrinomonadaceae bacterium]|jgi:hypothetical protein
MTTCTEINKAIKAGAQVYARIPGFSCDQRILRARVGPNDTLQVQFLVDGERTWRNAAYSAIRIEEAGACAGN